MAKSSEIKTVISADDKTKTSLNSAQKNIENFGKSAQKSTQNLSRNFNNLNNNLKKNTRTVQKTNATMGAFKGLLVAGIITKVGLAVKNNIGEFTNMSDALAKNSRQLDISVESLQGLNYAAKIQGVSTEALHGNFKKFNLQLKDLEDSESAFSKSLAKTNPELLKQLLSTKDGEQRFLMFADAVNKQEGATKKSALTAQILGKGGLEMIKFFDGGADAIKKLMGKQLEHGVISKATAESAEALADNITNIQTAGESLKNQLLSSLIPSLVTLTNTLANFLNNHKDLIISFAKTTRTLLPYVASIMGLYGGFKLLKGGISGSIGAVKSSIKAYRTISTGLSTVITFFKSLNVVQAINNALAMANPMGLIIAGIVVAVLLLIGFFILLYKKSEGFRNMVKSIATAFKNAFMPIINFITNFIDKCFAKLKMIGKFFGFGKDNKEESLEAPEPVNTPLSQQEQESKLDQEHYENKSKTNIDVNFNNLPKGVVVNQGKPVIGVTLNLGYSGS